MDKDTSDKTKSGDSGGDGGEVKSNGASGAKYVSRARGTSDAKWRLGRPGNDVSHSAIYLFHNCLRPNGIKLGYLKDFGVLGYEPAHLFLVSTSHSKQCSNAYNATQATHLPWQSLKFEVLK
jgi:hypothetical protein